LTFSTTEKIRRRAWLRAFLISALQETVEVALQVSEQLLYFRLGRRRSRTRLKVQITIIKVEKTTA
jgi:hypothetical protein